MMREKSRRPSPLQRRVLIVLAALDAKRHEKRLAWLLAVVLSLWVTESWHGVGPAWTGLAAAVITLLPRVGFINGEEFASGVNMRTCIYVAGILGLAIAVTQTGIGGAVGNALLQVMPLDKDNPFTSFLMPHGCCSARARGCWRSRATPGAPLRVGPMRPRWRM